jgi:hypothetical protein
LRVVRLTAPSTLQLAFALSSGSTFGTKVKMPFDVLGFYKAILEFFDMQKDGDDVTDLLEFWNR